MCKFNATITAAIAEAERKAPCSRFMKACLEFPVQDVAWMREREPEVFNCMVAHVNERYGFTYNGDAPLVIRHDSMESALEALARPYCFMRKLVQFDGFGKNGLTGIYTVTM